MNLAYPAVAFFVFGASLYPMVGASTAISQDHTPDDLITTGDAALLLGTSRQHVVDLCNRGLLPHVSAGTHRRVRRHDVVALQRTGERSLTRDQVRSLWIHAAVAGHLASNPNRVLGRARTNLERLTVVHPRGQAARWLREWQRLLAGPIEPILAALTSQSARSVELRQNSPFAGVLGPRERQRVLKSFRTYVDHTGG